MHLSAGWLPQGHCPAADSVRRCRDRPSEAPPWSAQHFPYRSFSGRFQGRFACDYNALACRARLSGRRPSCGRMRAGFGFHDTNSGAASDCGQAPAPEAPPASERRKPLAGRHSLRSRRNGGKPAGCSAGVAVKRHPPAFSRFGASGSRRHGGQLAGGFLRCLLTATADEVVGRSMAASPENRRLVSNPETGRHRTGASAAQSSGPARPRPVRQRRSSTGFTGTRRQPRH
jgi:hypothetical protein